MYENGKAPIPMGGKPVMRPPVIKDPGFFRPTQPKPPVMPKPGGPGQFQTGGPMPRPNFPVGGQTKPVGPGGKPANPMLDAMKRRLSGA